LNASTGLVLQAAPGAGKTTRVPLALLEAAWLGGAKLVMLEPRRLAARAAARRLADSLGEAVGETVGYRVRLDTRVGRRTRLEVVTEGVLTRMLQDDPTLHDVGLLIFDEFHERSIHADLGLALALQTQRLLRPELRLLVMSATLDVAPVAGLLGGAPIIASEGREFPVTTHYVDQPIDMRDTRQLEARVAATVERAVRDHPGDVLVFLPGIAEIRRVEEVLADRLPSGATVIGLHGSLPADLQDRAIAPSRPGERKIVLATSIAETSLTIEGVHVVVDSGLARVPRFSPQTALTRLETVHVTRASAEQRRGRAGRLGPGVCYRLWTEIEQGQLLPRATPEILSADLTPLALDLADAGIAEPAELSWLDQPPAAALRQARELLTELEALDVSGRLTKHGADMARLALHPRLAHMALRGRELGVGVTAAHVAALLGERDLLRSDASIPDADVRLRLELLARGSDRRVDRSALHRVRAEAEQLSRQLDTPARERIDPEMAGVLVALAYPDRIAQRRGAGRGRYLLRNGRGAALGDADPLGTQPFLAVAALDGRQPESRIFLAAPLSRADLDAHFGAQLTDERLVEWDARTSSVVAVRRTRLGAIVLDESPVHDADPSDVASVLARHLGDEGVDALPWSDAARRLRERIAFLHLVDATWPDVSDAALATSMDAWLAPRITGMRRRADVARLDLASALLERLTWQQRAALDELAPTH